MQTSAPNQEDHDSLLHLVAPVSDVQEVVCSYLPSCLSPLKTGVSLFPCVLVPMWVQERFPQPLQSSQVKRVMLGAALCHSCRTLATCPSPVRCNGERQGRPGLRSSRVNCSSRGTRPDTGKQTSYLTRHELTLYLGHRLCHWNRSPARALTSHISSGSSLRAVSHSRAISLWLIHC